MPSVQQRDCSEHEELSQRLAKILDSPTKACHQSTDPTCRSRHEFLANHKNRSWLNIIKKQASKIKRLGEHDSAIKKEVKSLRKAYSESILKSSKMTDSIIESNMTNSLDEIREAPANVIFYNPEDEAEYLMSPQKEEPSEKYFMESEVGIYPQSEESILPLILEDFKKKKSIDKIYTDDQLEELDDDDYERDFSSKLLPSPTTIIDCDIRNIEDISSRPDNCYEIKSPIMIGDSQALYSPLVDAIVQNHSMCMTWKEFKIPMSIQEILECIHRYREEIVLEESPDIGHLLMIPLNNNSLPKWIHPDQSLRVSRSSQWLRTESMVVSRNHCEIFHESNEFYLRDVGSNSGTYLNGQRISPRGILMDKVIKIQNGDILQLGIDCVGRKDLAAFKCIQVLLLIGIPSKSLVSKEEEGLEIQQMEKPSLTPDLIKIMRRKMKQMKIYDFNGANLRIFIYLNDGSKGCSIIKDDEGRLLWSASLKKDSDGEWSLMMTDHIAENLYTIEKICDSIGTFTINFNGIQMATVSRQSFNKIFIKTNFIVSITLDLEKGLFYFLQKQSGSSNFLGEGKIAIKKSEDGKEIKSLLHLRGIGECDHELKIMLILSSILASLG